MPTKFILLLRTYKPFPFAANAAAAEEGSRHCDDNNEDEFIAIVDHILFLFLFLLFTKADYLTSDNVGHNISR